MGCGTLENMFHKNSHSDPIYRLAIKAREEVRQLVRTKQGQIEAYEDTLACACAVGTYVLIAALKRHGIKAKLIMGIAYDCIEMDVVANHCWAQLLDGTIVDITATQFKQPIWKVFFRCDDPNYESVYEGKRAVAQLKHWPEGQNPLRSRDALLPAIKQITLED